MGGHSKSSAPAPAATANDISNAAIRPMTPAPAALPGQLDALSQQLAMGYGGQPSDLLALMNQYYQPMSLPNYAPSAGPVTGNSNSTGSSGTGASAGRNSKNPMGDYTLVQDAVTGGMVPVPRNPFGA